MTSPLWTRAAVRESIVDPANPVGLDGIEFIEYATSDPQSLGVILERMGFQPIARHRSRDVTLYRQGLLNVIVNAHGNGRALTQRPIIAAVAMRVRDASAAYLRALERGAWGIPVQVDVMELHIPVIHGVGNSRIYFVDRYDKFSIYDVDFTPIAGAQQHPPALADLHFFGLVQYIGRDRSDDWTEFYRQLFGFTQLPAEQRFGILPKGRILESPCAGKSRFYIQLVEPEASSLDGEDEECLQRVGLGCPDVTAAMNLLGERGVEFQRTPEAEVDLRGALTAPHMGSVSFELVRNESA